MDRTHLTSDQAEALVAGTANEEGVEDLATVIDSLRAYSSAPLGEDLVDQIVTAAARVSGTVADLPQSGVGRTRGAAHRGLRRKVTTIAASVALIFASGSAVAVAADGASPGDALYGIDQALEAIGIGDGGTQERLEEAGVLVANGEVALGLEHAATALAEADDDADHAASDALHRAAERAAEGGSGGADATKEGVAALLAYLAGNVGKIDGQHVAELAREIGNGPSDNPSSSNAQAPGRSDATNPGNAPDEPPGQSDTSNPGNSPDEPPGQSDTSNPGNSPDEPPGQSDTSNPGNSPDEPPGQSGDSGASGRGSPPSNPGNSPDEPPGQSKKGSNSGESSKPEKTK